MRSDNQFKFQNQVEGILKKLADGIKIICKDRQVLSSILKPLLVDFLVLDFLPSTKLGCDFEYYLRKPGKETQTVHFRFLLDYSLSLYTHQFQKVKNVLRVCSKWQKKVLVAWNNT